MFLKIKQGILIREYGDCACVQSESVKSLDITNMPAGVEIVVEKSNEGKHWKGYPNNDGSAFVITEDGTYGLTPGNFQIRLFVEDGTTIPEEFIATLA